MSNNLRHGSLTQLFTCLLLLSLMAGCASTKRVGTLSSADTEPTIELETTPNLFEEPKTYAATAGATETKTDQDALCTSAQAEIQELDGGLGGPAEESAPDLASPTPMQQVGNYAVNLGTETVLGYLQPFIQTKRALFNDDEKERRSREAIERGQIRRAYLRGLKNGADCPTNE